MIVVPSSVFPSGPASVSAPLEACERVMHDAGVADTERLRGRVRKMVGKERGHQLSYHS